MAQLTELEAINRILRANGEQPVSSLSTTGTNDTGIAQEMLDQAVTQFNIKFGVAVEATLTRDSNNRIPLPAEVLQVEGRGQYRDRQMVRRGSFLYDLTNATDIWTVDPTVHVKYQIEFTDLDPAFQYMIVDAVAVEYQADIKGDPEVDARLRERARMSAVVARGKLGKTLHRSWLSTTDLSNNVYRAP
jgi:hypothetical protein